MRGKAGSDAPWIARCRSKRSRVEWCNVTRFAVVCFVVQDAQHAQDVCHEAQALILRQGMVPHTVRCCTRTCGTVSLVSLTLRTAGAAARRAWPAPSSASAMALAFHLRNAHWPPNTLCAQHGEGRANVTSKAAAYVLCISSTPRMVRFIVTRCSLLVSTIVGCYTSKRRELALVEATQGNARQPGLPHAGHM